MFTSNIRIKEKFYLYYFTCGMDVGIRWSGILETAADSRLVQAARKDKLTHTSMLYKHLSMHKTPNPEVDGPQ